MMSRLWHWMKWYGNYVWGTGKVVSTQLFCSAVCLGGGFQFIYCTILHIFRLSWISYMVYSDIQILILMDFLKLELFCICSLYHIFLPHFNWIFTCFCSRATLWILHCLIQKAHPLQKQPLKLPQKQLL